MICIGIDTGTETGIAVWNSRTESLVLVSSVKIHQAMEMVCKYKNMAERDGDKLLVRVEDPRQRTWFGTERMSRETERKRLQGVGSVKRDASIWDDYLRDLGVSYEMVPPKWNYTKMSQEAFKNLTKWEPRTNEHGRDAAMLVFGR